MSQERSVVMDTEAWADATNPVLPGFHPDPSVCRVDGDDGTWFYLATSTFEYLPGLPVHRSRDLINWQLVGHVITDQLDFTAIGDSDGLFAPTIRHDGERFIVVCKFVKGPEGAGDNFVVTATDPAGPWSAPIWWPDADGGDTSLFLDNGRIWAHGARQTQRQDWPGQGEIWVREVDPTTLQLTGPETVAFTSAVTGGIWTEGPHLYRRGDRIHLIAAEGGTGRHHAVVSAHAASPQDVFTVGASNPVLTHRHLGEGAQVVNVGHAELVEAADGSWWALVLASRLVDGVDLLGRETFLVPVEWVGDEPVFAPGVGTLVPEPGGPEGASFERSQPPHEPWLAVRSLPDPILEALDESTIRLRAGSPMNAPIPAFVGQRLLAPSSTVSLDLNAKQDAGIVECGLAMRQSASQWLTAGIEHRTDGTTALTITRSVRGESQLVHHSEISAPGRVYFDIDGRSCEISWASNDSIVSLACVDIGHLSTTEATGFVGAVVGPYARGEGVAEFGRFSQERADE